MLCIGLDTVLEKLPALVRQKKDPLFTFNRAVIDASADLAAAFKINTAFYEAYGIEGWRALEATFKYLPEDVIKIADAKRGDIGNSSKMYARAIFEELGADAITVNPLMGTDSVAPFLENPEKGVFFLCLTSNQGSRDFQHFSDGQQKLYERIADQVNTWNIGDNCGLVVGATHPDELRAIRQRVPRLPFLIPGIGAQGGNLEKSVQYGLDSQGTGAIFNSSRAIIYASDDVEFERAVRSAAEQTRSALNVARQQSSEK